MMRTFLSLIGVETARAQGFIQSIVDQASLNSVGVGGSTNGGAGFNAILLYVVGAFRPLLFVTAAIALTVMGLRMVIGQEDDSLEKAKTTVSAAVSGIVLAMLMGPFVEAFVTMQGGGVNGAGAAGVVSREAFGLIDWGLGIAGSLAVLFIVVSGVKAVANPTNEEGLSNLRQTVISVIIGVVILAARLIIASAVGGTLAPNPLGLLAIPIAIAKAIFLFLGLLAVAVIVYAGVLMVLNYANEEQIQKGKSLLYRAVTGLVLIILCFSIVQFVVTAIQ